MLAAGNIAQVGKLRAVACSGEQFRQAAAAADYLRKDRRKKPRQERSGAVMRQEPEL